MGNSDLPTLTITLLSQGAGKYEVELAFTRLTTATDPPPELGTADFLPEALLQASIDASKYGTLLAKALFASPNLRDFFITSLAIAKSNAQPYRIRLRIHTNAAELHNLRWETICHPQTGAFLVTDAHLRWSREIYSPDWSEIVLRPRGELRTLVAVASPAELKRGVRLLGQTLAEVDVAGELERAERALRGVGSFEKLSSPDSGPWQVTLENLAGRLRQGYDILYLVCHGAMLPENPYDPSSPHKTFLLLERPDGRKDLLSGENLISQVAALDAQIMPRLVVLAACQSGGKGQNLESDTAASADRGAMAALGPRLAEAGVPAVIAMQGNIKMKTVEKFLPVFFEELVKDGQLERAMALARSAAIAAQRDDWWVPTLYTRLKEGLLFPPTQPLAAAVIEKQPYEPETIFIPASSFIMGRQAGPGVPQSETPQGSVFLPAYRIGIYPVTNNEFVKFIRQTRRLVAPEMGWEGQNPPKGQEEYPVRGVTWFEAMDYCRWLTDQTGRDYSLPSEAQWEKAARGEAGNLYPWGNDWQPQRSNQGNSHSVPVRSFPTQNDLGLCDLVGNVLQWTTTLWGEKRMKPDPQFCYPWQDDGRDDPQANKQIRRVLRGSSYMDAPQACTCTTRLSFLPADRGRPGKRHGFRIVMILKGRS
jgi:formylglycine-generating enzyme required for sulfatase activity